jgi:hypothetical protein
MSDKAKKPSIWKTALGAVAFMIFAQVIVWALVSKQSYLDHLGFGVIIGISAAVGALIGSKL